MNTYKFDDLTIGLTEQFTHTVTEAEMDAFRNITGDVNPFHADDEFAKEHGFAEKVVFGMLTASLISTLGGVYLPGKYCLIQQTEIKFVSPVFVGDELTVVGKVDELNETVKRAGIKIEIRNSAGKKVVKAKLYVGFLE